MNGIRRRFTLPPRRASTAGNKVSAAATAPIATTIAPTARLRMIVLSTSSRPTIASTNALPLKRTARLAVAPAVAIASAVSRPCAYSSRKRETMTERVVDPEGEAHAREHVHHEERASPADAR